MASLKNFAIFDSGTVTLACHATIQNWKINLVEEDGSLEKHHFKENPNKTKPTNFSQWASYPENKS